MTNVSKWTEVFDGGSSEAERDIFRALAEDMLRVQEANRLRAQASRPARTLHAKLVAGITDAELVVDTDLPPDFAVAYFQPGTSCRATLRLSNASGVAQHDTAPDMRGAAIRVNLTDGAIHDLLMTNFPVSHARNARQFVDFAVIASSGGDGLQARLIEKFGTAEVQRMFANLGQAVRPCGSFALERFWSRGAVLWGENPVRFALRPAADAPPGPDSLPDGAEALRLEMADRLAKGPVRYRLALQRFIDEMSTPIEDGAIEWREEQSPFIEVATLILPQQDLLGEAGIAQAAAVDHLEFNPWNAPPEFRPLGNLNRARRMVYGKSAERWQSPEEVGRA